MVEWAPWLERVRSNEKVAAKDSWAITLHVHPLGSTSSHSVGGRFGEGGGVGPGRREVWRRSRTPSSSDSGGRPGKSPGGPGRAPHEPVSRARGRKGWGGRGGSGDSRTDP